MANDKQGARSYKSEVIGDSMAITINFNPFSWGKGKKGK